MERRVPLALLLCFLVLLLWARMFPPPPPETDPNALGPNATGLDGSGTPAEVVSGGGNGLAVQPGAMPSEGDGAGVEPTGAVELAASDEEVELLLGEPGRAGRFLARFSNRGARLLELRCGDYFRRSELTAAQREDPNNWVVLLEPWADGRAGFGSDGSLALRRSDGPQPGAVDLHAARWLMEVLDEQPSAAGGPARAAGIRFRCAPGDGFVYEKIVRAVPGSFDLEVELRIVNPEGGAMLGGPRSFRLVPAAVVPPELRDPYYVQPTAIAVAIGSGDKVKTAREQRRDNRREPTGFLRVPSPISFAGIHSKYFAALLRPMAGDSSATLQTARWTHLPAPPSVGEPELDADDRLASQISCELELALDLPPPGGERSFAYRLYAGPKDHATFLDANALHGAVHESDLSWFSGIGRLLTKILHFLHGLVGNWGVAIILLTLLIRAILFPLNRRAQTAMARYQSKMKRVQPKLEESKKKYEDDPQRLRQEQARIMQEEGAFPPLGGCLPIFLQMPIFFGLFSALRTSFELRRAPFVGWIDDLSRPDRLMDFGEAVPFQSMRYLNLLPILMVVLWIWQQRTMPQPSDEQAKRMQRIMLFMPLVMGVFLYNYAAGLSLYMMTQSGLGIFEQKVIKKYWPVDDTEVEKKKGGCAPFAEKLAAMAEEQQKQREALQKSGRGQVKRKPR